MSRVGKNPVTIPQGVTVDVAGGVATVKGKLGTLKLPISKDVTVSVKDGKVLVEPQGETQQSRIMWGTTRANLRNMVDGVSKGYSKALEINGVGYRAAVQGKNLQLQMGYSHDVLYPIPEGITIKCEKPTAVLISGFDKQKAKQSADGPKKEGEQKAKDLKAAGQEESDKLSHKICAELDASAGQCIADYLPDPGGKKGNQSSVSATVTGEVTIPIPETPLSAKVGQGAKVEVARTGTKSYTVSITGDAMLYLNAGVGNAGASADVKVDLPGGGKGNPGKVWEKLKGGGAPAATPAVTPGAAPAAGGKDDNYKGDLDVGYRAQSALVYGFTAGETNCKGLGGLVTLLGVLGVKGGGGFLGELAMLGAQESFEDNLQSRKFTLAEGVVMSGEIKNEFAKAGVKVSGEAGVTVGQERDESGKMVDTLEVFVGGAGELTGEIDAGVVSGVGGGVAGAGKVTMSLGYVKDEKAGTEEIKATKLKGELSATGSVAASNLNKIGEVTGPAVLAEIRKAVEIDKTNLDPTMASLTGAVSGEVDPSVVTRELGPILDDPESASLQSLKTAGANILKDKKTAGSASLTLTMSERLAGVGFEAEQRSAEMRAGAKASAALDRTETRVLWSKEYAGKG
jgi:large subunit ribosomal protein L6